MTTLKTLIKKSCRVSIYLVLILVVQLDLLMSVLNNHLVTDIFFRIAFISGAAIVSYMVISVMGVLVLGVTGYFQKKIFKKGVPYLPLGNFLFIFFILTNYFFISNLYTIHETYTIHSVIWNFVPDPVTYKIDLIIIFFSVLLGFLMAYFSALFIQKYESNKLFKVISNWKLVSLFYVLIFLSITIIIPHPSVKEKESLPEKVRRSPTNNKVILVYMESLCMDRIMQYTLNDDLPAFKELIKNGAWGNIKTIFPSFSPVVSTSVITGKLPQKHKILSYTSMKIPFSEKPLLAIPAKYGFRSIIRFMKDANIRKCPPVNYKSIYTNTLWDILNTYGCGIANIGWCASWPAMKFDNGVNITDRFEVEGYDHTVSFSGENKELCRQDYLNEFKLSSFFDTTFMLGGKSNYLKDSIYIFHGYENPVHVIDSAFYRDKRFMNISLNCIRNNSFDLYTVFLPGLDIIEHGYWEFMAPENVEDSSYMVDKKGMAIFKNTIRSYYRFYDNYITNILNSMDSLTTLIVISGHGMFPGISYEDGKISADHRYRDTRGAGFIYGNGIKRGFDFEERSVLDITPTILVLLGLPVAGDMDGAVASNVMESNFLNKNVPKCIESYDFFNPKEIELFEPPIKSRNDLYKIHLYD